MSDLDEAQQHGDFKASIGLCSVCVNKRVVPHPRGGTPYFMCQLAVSDSRFRKFPPLPVGSCPGYQFVDHE